MNDLTTDDRERLARFAGKVTEGTFFEPAVIIRKDPVLTSFACELREWKPDLLNSEQWQLQACFEAVEEAGMVEPVRDELMSMVTEQICRAILLCLEESDVSE